MTDTDPSTAAVTDEAIFAAHAGGKLRVESKVPLDDQRALSIAYTPGVAVVSRAIAADHTLAARRTHRNQATPRFILGKHLGERGHDAPAGCCKRVTGCKRAPPNIEPRPVDSAQRLLQAQTLPTEHGIFPGFEGAQHLRRKRLMNLIEIEVL